MKIIILALDHIYANKVIKDLVQTYPKDISLIVDSGVIVPKKSTLAGFLKYLKISGIHYVWAQTIKLLLYKSLSFFFTLIFPNKINGKFYSFRKLAKTKRIKVIKIKEINSPTSQNILRIKKPELLVSVFFNQVLKPETIKIAEYGAINIHPAYLPDYKGISPVFWALANGETETGVSIHKVDDRIDTGKIIARSRIKIQDKETEDSLYWRAVKVGSPLLISTIKAISNNKVKYLPNTGGRYFSFPTGQATKSLKRNGRAFYSLRGFIFKG